VQQHPADRGEADDDGDRDRPSADADVADGLPLGFVLRDSRLRALSSFPVSFTARPPVVKVRLLKFVT